MKEYINDTLQKSKSGAYKIFSKNNDLMELLDKKYPFIPDLISKIQLYIRDLDDFPKCKYSGCNTKIHLNRGKFARYCSKKCSIESQRELGLLEERSKKYKNTILEKYGVDNYAKTEEYKEKTQKTNLEKYGVEFFTQTETFKEKSKKTINEKYGTESYTQSHDYKNKARKTNMEKYGTETYAGSEDFKKKAKHTNQEKYGADYYVQTDDFAKKSKSTFLERYGEEYYILTDEFKNKTKETNLEKYGVDHYSKSDGFNDMIKKTNMERYGVEHFVLTDEFKEKAKETNLERHGVDHYSKSGDFKETIKQTNLEKYGVEYFVLTDEFKEKSKETNMKNYGVDHYSKTDEFKEKCEKTSLENYGVGHSTKKHYNSDYKNFFNNKQEFEKMLYEHGTYKLADLINCDVSTIHKFASNNNIVLPPRPKSYQEEIMTDFLVENNIPFVSNTKKILPSGKELDFYLPDHNLAIEINGLYWHTELSGGKDRNYHYIKWKECDDLGITLLSIQEDEFADNKQFWLNKMLYMTGNLSLTKIHARKCEIRELDNVTDFLNHHHLQGSCASSYKFGLFIENILVSVMTFSTPRNNKSGVIDLSRFCNHSGYIVSGGASKLLSYFIKKYGNMYNSIISFSDNNYSNGNVYKALGFSLTTSLSPDYKYVLKGKRYHKAKFRKSEIFKKFDIPEDMKNKSEWELMQYLGYDRIWDTGKKKWELKI